MDRQIYAIYDVEVITVSENIKLYSLMDNVTLRFFISVDNIDQLVTKNFYNNIKFLQKYPIEQGQLYKVFVDDGSTETIWDIAPITPS